MDPKTEALLSTAPRPQLKERELVDKIRNAPQSTYDERVALWHLVQEWESRAELRNRVKMILDTK